MAGIFYFLRLPVGSGQRRHFLHTPMQSSDSPTARSLRITKHRYGRVPPLVFMQNITGNRRAHRAGSATHPKRPYMQNRKTRLFSIRAKLYPTSIADSESPSGILAQRLELWKTGGSTTFPNSAEKMLIGQVDAIHR